MSRADRLFRIVSILKQEKLVTARQLSQSLEVSERTIYRDISQLMTSGVLISGEPGLGYSLEHGFEMPALNFTIGELQALLLSARMMRTWADDEMADHAFNMLRKIEKAVPDSLRRTFDNLDLFVPSVAGTARDNLGPVRNALQAKRKIHMDYLNQKEELSQRTIQPLGLFFWGKVWTLVAWCEIRQDFRHFRVDRIQKLKILEENCEPSPGQTLKDYLKSLPEYPH
jgi:predicted DNA-binding transcriptional regulator YafY